MTLGIKKQTQQCFEFQVPTRLYFGLGTLARLPSICAPLGSKALIVTGKSSMHASDRLSRIVSSLEQNKIKAHIYSGVSPEPSTHDVEEGFSHFKTHYCDFIIGIGGGSALDVAKAIALKSSNPSPLNSYEGLEKLSAPPCNIVAIPTTAGTGSEVTPYSVLTNPDSGRKFTINSRLLCPKAAIVDPELNVSMPRDTTVATAVDAMIHCLEGFISKKSTPLTDPLALKGFSLVYQWLPRVLRRPNDIQARTQLSLAAALGGLVILHVRTGLIHTMSVAIGGQTNLSHGISNALATIASLEYNANHCKEKFQALAEEITDSRNSTVDPSGLISKLKVFFTSLKIPQRLSEIGLGTQDIPALCKRVLQDKGLGEVNPRGRLHKENIDAIFRSIV